VIDGVPLHRRLPVTDHRDDKSRNRPFQRRFEDRSMHYHVARCQWLGWNRAPARLNGTSRPPSLSENKCLAASAGPSLLTAIGTEPYVHRFRKNERDRPRRHPNRTTSCRPAMTPVSPQQKTEPKTLLLDACGPVTTPGTVRHEPETRTTRAYHVRSKARWTLTKGKRTRNVTRNYGRGLRSLP
jgi:hypothetical protein